MLKLIFTSLVTLLVLTTACEKKEKKAAGPSIEQRLYGYWTLEPNWARDAAAADPIGGLPPIGVMKLELNRNNVNEINYCATDKSVISMTKFEVKDGFLEVEFSRMAKIKNSMPTYETLRHKITILTSDRLQLDGKYEYQRFYPAREVSWLSSKESPYCHVRQ